MKLSSLVGMFIKSPLSFDEIVISSRDVYKVLVSGENTPCTAA